jgi:cysteine desulfuration protein SufE
MPENDTVPARLQEIIADFQLSEGREKVEMLLEFSEQLPPLPDRMSAQRDCMEKVEECMTPVFVQAEVEDNSMHFYFDIPRESPTVRGFAAILSSGLDGLAPAQVLAVPNDFYQKMGLDRVLTSQRLNGIAAILAHMKRLAAESMAQK